jgi:FAD/FMN-containing dehydrogenase
MRYRLVFFTGLGIGFVLGARAGRERYEQLRKLARKAADSPAVQQAAGALQAQAASAAKAAGGMVAGRAGAARAKVGGALHDHVPGMRVRESNGHPASGAGGNYAETPGTAGGAPGG